MELVNVDDKVIHLHGTEEAVASNVVALRPSVELNIVELDNVVELHTFGEETLGANEGPCVDGVCSLSWKPKRPSAA